MKTLQQMLRELARPEVAELAVASDRLPCVKVGGKYEPIDDKARSTEAILEMLVAVGGSRYVEELEKQAQAWATRVDGVGSVGIQAVMRDGRAQARFVVVRRASAPPPPPAKAHTRPPSHKSRPPAKKSIPPAAQAKKSIPPGRKSMPPKTASRKSIPAMRLPKESPAPPKIDYADPASESIPSEPLLRAAVVKPSRATGAVPAPQPAAVVAAALPGGADALLASARDAGASDVHVIAGRPLLVRVRGELLPQGAPIAESAVEAMVLPLVPPRLASVLAEQGSCDFAVDVAGVRPLPRQRRAPAHRPQGRASASSRREVPTLASLGLPPEIATATHHHQGLIVITGPDRARQDDDARGDRRHLQPRDDAPRHHRRGSDRVRAPAQERDDQPARGRHAHAVVRAPRSRPRCARIPTSSSSASCATPRRCAWRSRRARRATS